MGKKQKKEGRRNRVLHKSVKVAVRIKVQTFLKRERSNKTDEGVKGIYINDVHMGKIENHDKTQTKDMDHINKYKASFTLATTSNTICKTKSFQKEERIKRQAKIYQANAKKKRQELQF